MITVAVTGGIGSGKSTVSAALRDRGAVVIDSDQLAREVVAPGTAGIAAIGEAFGGGVIGADGALDRAAIAAVVFAHPSARAVLEGITHPLVRARFGELQRQAPTDAVVVNDIPLLTTLTAAATFHLVVGVRADAQVRIDRLVERGLAEADARARMAVQLSDDQRAELCDVVLTNHGARADLVADVDELWTNRLLPFEENTRMSRPATRGSTELVDPRGSWAVDARRLAARVSAAVGGARVDHVGCTAVPAMPAADVVELQLSVPDLTAAAELARPLAAAGFPPAGRSDHHPVRPAGVDGARWQEALHVNADPCRTLNLYLRVRDSPTWRWSLLFRDWLRADSATAAQYLAVVRSTGEPSAGEISTGRPAEAVQSWIGDAYPRGLAWAAQAGWSPGPG